MQDHHTHAAQNSLLNTNRDFIRNLLVRHMSPPHQNIRTIQYFIGQAFGQLVQCNSTNLHFVIFKVLFKRHMNAIRIDGPNSFILLFMNEFIVDHYPNHTNPSFMLLKQ